MVFLSSEGVRLAQRGSVGFGTISSRYALAKMTPERRARIEERAQKLLAEMPLYELRQARRLTQEALAAAMGKGQASISKLERRTDMYVGTLRSLIQAMGGELEIRARFPEGDVKITQFSVVKATRQRKQKRAAARSSALA